MCGIVGASAQRDVAPILLEGLRRLEYRGYDSAGMALVENGRIERTRAVGKVAALADRLGEHNPGTLGIAHTRWATHGGVNETNAHPACLERPGRGGPQRHHREPRGAAQATGRGRLSLRVGDRHRSCRPSHRQLSRNLGHAGRGGAPCRGRTARRLCARRGRRQRSGYARGDPPRLAARARRGHRRAFRGLRRGGAAAGHAALRLSRGRRHRHPHTGRVSRSPMPTATRSIGPCRNPACRSRPPRRAAIGTSCSRRSTSSRAPWPIPGRAAFRRRRAGLQHRPRGRDVACPRRGRAYRRLRNQQPCRHGRSLLDRAEGRAFPATSNWPANTATAIRSYRRTVCSSRSRQSGETADTLAALRYAKTRRRRRLSRTLAICNKPETSLTRESDLVMMTRAGPEIGVASTKAFTTQLAVSAPADWPVGHGPERAKAMVNDIRGVPNGGQARARTRRRDQPSGRAVCRQAACPVPRPGPDVPDRYGRRAQAQGDLLPPRGSLCRRRTQARPAGAGRRGHAGGGGRPE